MRREGRERGGAPMNYPHQLREEKETAMIAMALEYWETEMEVTIQGGEGGNPLSARKKGGVPLSLTIGGKQSKKCMKGRMSKMLKEGGGYLSQMHQTGEGRAFDSIPKEASEERKIDHLPRRKGGNSLARLPRGKKRGA